jgi:electron transport complex protein RnfB
MAAVTFEVVFAGCAGCGACLLTCPTHAIRPIGGELHARRNLCTGCGECVEVCPVDAIQIHQAEEKPTEKPAAEKSAEGRPAVGKPAAETTAKQIEEWPR